MGHGDVALGPICGPSPPPWHCYLALLLSCQKLNSFAPPHPFLSFFCLGAGQSQATNVSQLILFSLCTLSSSSIMSSKGKNWLALCKSFSSVHPPRPKSNCQDSVHLLRQNLANFPFFQTSLEHVVIPFVWHLPRSGAFYLYMHAYCVLSIATIYF